MQTVYIYGASNKGRNYLTTLKTFFQVEGFLDKDPKKHGALIDDVEIFDLQTLNLNKDTQIIITSDHENEIATFLSAIGFQNVASVHTLNDVEKHHALKIKKLRQNKVNANSRNKTNVKVSLGSEGIAGDDWIVTEQAFLNIALIDDWKNCFDEDSIDVIFAEHVWEHLTPQDALIATTECFRHLKPGGTLRLAVPDGFHESHTYIEEVKPGGFGNGSEDHKVLFNYKSLSELLSSAGFQLTLLEYYDEHHILHTHPWDIRKGKVRRSVHYYPYNGTDKINYNYSSLIVDATKPVT